MPRDEQLRRSISEKVLSDEWIKRGSVNKLSKEREIMYRCPECDHRAFALSPNSGWFHCWACGIWGQTQEGAAVSRKRWEETHNMASQSNISAPSARAISPKVAPSGSLSSNGNYSSPPLGEVRVGASIIEDYVQLDERVLEDVEDISLDTTVTGAQLAVRNYLQSQQIPIDWARKMRWGVAQYVIKLKGEDVGKQRPCLVYRNYVEGICCNAKFRAVSTKVVVKNTRQGQIQRTVIEKGFAQESSFTPCAPYNIDCMRREQDENEYENENRRRTLIITEGEKDCLTLRMLGFMHVIAAANGAQTDHAKSFEAFREWLSDIDTVIICGDMDKPGRSMVAALVDYFDTTVVKVCHWDQRYYGKDISDVRLRCGDDVARDFVLTAQPVTREDIEDFASDDAREAVYQSAIGNYDLGYSVGMGSKTNEVFRLNSQGGLIIVTGVPGTGKTDFLNYLTMSLIRERKSHVCYCSFETPDKYRHAGDLARLWAGPSDLSVMSREEVLPFSDFIARHITHIRMRRDRPTPAAVIRKAESVLAMHPSMEYLVIDPYLYLSLNFGHGTSQTDAIKDMLTEIQDWAHSHHVWVFLVAHPRMLRKEDGGEEFEEVSYYTISGSANWANVADFIFSLKRIKKTNCDYTRMNVLKVRDQKLCHPGEVFYKRQDCGRYDECASETEAIAGTVITQDVLPWELF